MTLERKVLRRLHDELVALDGRLKVLQGVGVKVSKSQRAAVQRVIRLLRAELHAEKVKEGAQG